MGYSYKAGKDEAKAIGMGLPISYKHGVNVCDSVRGKKLSFAKTFLKEVVLLKRPVPYRKYNLEMAHNSGVGSGRYPSKTCEHILKIIENAEANAQTKGLNSASLVVKHIACNKGGKIMSYGRNRSERKVSNVEIVLAEASR